LLVLAAKNNYFQRRVAKPPLKTHLQGRATPHPPLQIHFQGRITTLPAPGNNFFEVGRGDPPLKMYLQGRVVGCPAPGNEFPTRQNN